jgi:hypothetical protein
MHTLGMMRSIVSNLHGKDRENPSIFNAPTYSPFIKHGLRGHS